MAKSVFNVRLSKSVGEELIPYIEEIIPAEARKKITDTETHQDPLH